jgi:hypothetical protein
MYLRKADENRSTAEQITEATTKRSKTEEEERKHEAEVKELRAAFEIWKKERLDELRKMCQNELNYMTEARDVWKKMAEGQPIHKTQLNYHEKEVVQGVMKRMGQNLEKLPDKFRCDFTFDSLRHDFRCAIEECDRYITKIEHISQGLNNLEGNLSEHKMDAGDKTSEISENTVGQILAIGEARHFENFLTYLEERKGMFQTHQKSKETLLMLQTFGPKLKISQQQLENAKGVLRLQRKWIWRRGLFQAAKNRSFHGLVYIPPEIRSDFTTMEIPANIQDEALTFDNGHCGGNGDLASSYDFSKAFVSFLQALWGIYTVYKSFGTQIDQYGYAAFGLTVTPYLFMSFTNVVVNLVTPTYDSAFLVWTPDMEAARNRGAVFDGVVGRLDIDKINKSDLEAVISPEANSAQYTRRSPWFYALSAFLALVPIAIVGGLSGFRAGNSTALQRGFTMTWLVSGIFAGFLVGLWSVYAEDSVAIMYLSFVSWAPALGGMVVVGKMLREYGTCSQLP